MGTIIGVIVGYALGTRAGPRGWAELLDAWKVISTSEEVRDVVSGGVAVAKELLGRGGEMLAGALSDGESSSRLQPAA